jgi:hypothetical protein
MRPKRRRRLGQQFPVIGMFTRSNGGSEIVWGGPLGGVKVPVKTPNATGWNTSFEA